jgi:hypothetical protein
MTTANRSAPPASRRRAVDEVVVVQDQCRGSRDRCPELGRECVEHDLQLSGPGGEFAEERFGVRCERRVELAPRRHEVVEQDGPVAVGLVQPVPETSDPGAPAEIGEKGGLAVAGIGHDQDEAGVDPDMEPVEEPVAPERLLGEERWLDLALLDRVAVDLEPSGWRGDGTACQGVCRPSRDGLARTLPLRAGSPGTDRLHSARRDERGLSKRAGHGEDPARPRSSRA